MFGCQSDSERDFYSCMRLYGSGMDDAVLLWFADDFSLSCDEKSQKKKSDFRCNLSGEIVSGSQFLCNWSVLRDFSCVSLEHSPVWYLDSGSRCTSDFTEKTGRDMETNGKRGQET